jgi:hypothetical protein
MKTILSLFLLLCLTGCSHLGQVTTAETRQTVAMVNLHHSSAKVEKDDQAEMSEIANLATQERLVLSLPETSQTSVALTTLADHTLSIAGAPSENETRLASEVKALLAGGEIQQKEIVRLDNLVASLQKTHQVDVVAKQKADSVLATTTTKLYQVATASAQSADLFHSIFKWVFIALGLIALWVLARIVLKVMENTSATAATVAAKAP